MRCQVPHGLGVIHRNGVFELMPHQAADTSGSFQGEPGLVVALDAQAHRDPFSTSSQITLPQRLSTPGMSSPGLPRHQEATLYLESHRSVNWVKADWPSGFQPNGVCGSKFGNTTDFDSVTPSARDGVPVEPHNTPPVAKPCIPLHLSKA